MVLTRLRGRLAYVRATLRGRRACVCEGHKHFPGYLTDCAEDDCDCCVHMRRVRFVPVRESDDNAW